MTKWISLFLFLFLVGIIDGAVSGFPGKGRKRAKRGGGGGFQA